MARVAALRSAQPEELATGPQVPQQLGLAEDEDGTVPAEAGATGPEKDPDVCHACGAIAPDRGKGG